jgi:L-alanine-DL-glutamate epimerase-like enolase superfamily enzyme
MRRLSIATERYPVAGRFTISRGSRTEAVVLVAKIEANGVSGRGECVPYPRYGETTGIVIAQIEGARARIEAGADRAELQQLLPAGAARNALDCALWDLEAKEAGVPAHVLARIDRLGPVVTAYTLSLDTPEAMGEAAARASGRPILKIKLGGGAEDASRLAAVRRNAPDAAIIADANEGWRPEELEARLALCAEHGVALVEQPLPAGADAKLATVKRAIPVCADESVHTRDKLSELAGRYDAVNVKLDKTGGLTEALALAAEAERQGFSLMIGCMLGSSLAMAPALLLAGRARFVDLDGPLLLASDRPEGLRYVGSIVHPPRRELWG